MRRAAVAKLMDPAVAGARRRDDADEACGRRPRSMLRDIALEAFEETGERDSLAAVDAITDPKMLAQVAKSRRARRSPRGRSAGSSDAHALGSIARHAALEPIRDGACVADCTIATSSSPSR